MTAPETGSTGRPSPRTAACQDPPRDPDGSQARDNDREKPFRSASLTLSAAQNSRVRWIRSGGTIEALPECVQAGGGKIRVLIDGGFRRGTDVFKALALGASAVGIGRPYLWGVGAFGYFVGSFPG
jgi:hypothetical protein